MACFKMEVLGGIMFVRARNRTEAKVRILDGLVGEGEFERYPAGWSIDMALEDQMLLGELLPSSHEEFTRAKKIERKAIVESKGGLVGHPRDLAYLSDEVHEYADFLPIGYHSPYVSVSLPIDYTEEDYRRVIDFLAGTSEGQAKEQLERERSIRDIEEYLEDGNRG